jgi:hypothetical protein
VQDQAPAKRSDAINTYGGRPSSYKTRLCMKWQQHGECSFANHCNFAHGHEELRTGGSTAGASAAAASSSSASASKGSHATPQIPPSPHPPRIDVALHSGDSKGEQQQQSADAMVLTAKSPQQQQAEAADQQRQQLQEQALQQAQPHQREQGHRSDLSRTLSALLAFFLQCRNFVTYFFFITLLFFFNHARRVISSVLLLVFHITDTLI